MRTLLLCLVPPLLVAAAVVMETQSLERYDRPSGTVSDADGRPLAGAFVSVLDTARGVTVSVVTDAEGRYRLPPGVETENLRLRAARPGYVAQTRPADAAPDFVLPPSDDVFGALPSSALVSLLPDGEEKRRFLLDCAGCHQFDQKTISFEGRLKSREQWRTRIEQMLAFAGAHTGFPIMSPSRDAARTANWLVAHLGGPDAPLPAPPISAPAPPTERVVVTEYDLPARHDLPHDLMPDADGRLVVTGMMTGQMYRLDPATGVFETLPIPIPHAGPRALDMDGPDWWVLLGNPRRIARYTPATGAWVTYDIGMYPHSIRRDRRGRIWFNGHFTKTPELIGYLDPSSGAVETFEVPSPPMPDGGSTIPYGLRIDARGTVWATQLVGNRLVRFDPAPQQFTLYELPTPHSGPRRPDVGPDGIVWIPAFAANRLVRFDPATERFTEYDLPVPGALPYITRVDPRSGAVWIATAAADAVLRFHPATGRFDVHPLPTPKALVRHMELDPEAEAAWVAYGNSPAVDPKIARIEGVR